MQGIEMKDVALKLKNWKQIDVKNTKTSDLIGLQKSLQRFYIKKYNGDDRRIFIDVDNIEKISFERKIQITKQNVLRIFDEVSECFAWVRQYEENLMNSENIDQNLMFELIDILHFLFNIVSVWQIQEHIGNFENMKQFCFDERKQYSYIKDNICNLQIITSLILSCISWKSWKNVQKTDEVKLMMAANKMMIEILHISQVLGYKISDIYKMYISKNNQNKQRQLNVEGYK